MFPLNTVQFLLSLVHPAWAFFPGNGFLTRHIISLMISWNLLCKRGRRTVTSAVYGEVSLKGSTYPSTDIMENDVAIKIHPLNLTFGLLVCSKRQESGPISVGLWLMLNVCLAWFSHCCLFQCSSLIFPSSFLGNTLGNWSFVQSEQNFLLKICKTQKLFMGWVNPSPISSSHIWKDQEFLPHGWGAEEAREVWVWMSVTKG